MDFDTYVKQPLPFEDEISKYFASNDPVTIFEIGSCEGEDTIRLRKRFPKATIYTFEPLPSNIKIIKHNFKKYGLSTKNLFQLALSNSNGVAGFYVSSGHPKELPKTKDWDYGNKSSSLLPPKEHKKLLKWVKFERKIKVKTQRLDTFCEENNIEKIDFIYLDVQGAELMVLEGAGQLLSRVGVVWMEVEAIELYKGQPLKTSVESFMESHNFIRLKDTVDNVSGDQLYVRTDLSKKTRFQLQTIIKFLRSKY